MNDHQNHFPDKIHDPFPGTGFLRDVVDECSGQYIEWVVKGFSG
jgi:hypothetical protein